MRSWLFTDITTQTIYTARHEVRHALSTIGSRLCPLDGSVNEPAVSRGAALRHLLSHSLLTAHTIIQSLLSTHLHLALTPFLCILGGN